MNQHNYRKLEAYQTSFHMGLDVLELASKLPIEVTDTIRPAMLNASQMVSVKIAEGWARRNRPGALNRHLSDARDALNELHLWLMVSKGLRYITTEDYLTIAQAINPLHQQLEMLEQHWVVYN